MKRAQASRPHSQALWRVFRIPLLLGLFNLVGLVSALIGDGVWDVLSWVALGIPIALMYLHLRTAGHPVQACHARNSE